MMAAPRLEGTVAALGAGGRKNQIAYSLLKSQAPARNVVFFGGDSVDSQGHDAIERLSKPENIISVLLEKFKASNVWVISPTRYDGPWACYDNFLIKTTMSGEPMGYNGRELHACTHLHALLRDTLLRSIATPSAHALSGEACSTAAAAPSTSDGRAEVGKAAAASEGDEENEWDVFMQSPFFSWSWAWTSPATGGLVEPLLGGDEEAGPHDVRSFKDTADGGEGIASGGDLEAAEGVRVSTGDVAGESVEVCSSSGFQDGGSSVESAPGTILVGFSKGGVVLNQILTEMAALEESLTSQSTATTGGSSEGQTGPQDTNVSDKSKVLAFTRTIEEVHYLDVGLNCRGAYVTDPRVIQWIAKSAMAQPRGLLLAFHGTPRQWADRNRRWIVQEKDRCVSLLRDAIAELGDAAAHSLKVVERSYFDGEKPSLSMHFKVIEAMVVDG